MNKFENKIGSLNDLFTHIRKHNGEDVESFPLNFELVADGPPFQSQVRDHLIRFGTLAHGFMLEEDLYVDIKKDLIPKSISRIKDGYKLTNISFSVRSGRTIPVSGIAPTLERLNLDPDEIQINTPGADHSLTDIEIDNFIDIIIQVEGGSGSLGFRGRDLKFYLKSSKESYSIKDIEKKIKSLTEEIGEDEKAIDIKKQTLESYGWIHTFMKESKIDKEEKTSLQTKLIMSIVKESSDDDNEISTNISEVLNLNI